MGKNKRVFETDLVKIIVSDGEVIKCHYCGKIVTPHRVLFKETLEEAMNEMAFKEPRTFIAMYKTLFLSTREYKIAKKLYEKYDLKI